MVRLKQPGGMTRTDLSDASDRLLLIAAFLSGTAGIVFLKFAWQFGWLPVAPVPETHEAGAGAWRSHVPTASAALLAGAVLLIYAVAARIMRGHAIEPETTGDNCYYLGFLFTLVSLAATLFQLGVEDAASSRLIVDRVISGFGIALVSTIIGIMLRVYFFQQRTDLAARQNEMALELQKAIRNFRSQLSSNLVSMKKFSTESVQLAQERDRRVQDEVEAASKLQLELIERVRNAADDASRRQREEISRTNEQMVNAIEDSLKRAVERIPATIGDAVGKSAKDAFDGLDEPARKLGSSLDEMATRSISGSEGLIEQLKVLESRLVILAGSLDSAVGSLSSRTKELAAATEQAAREIENTAERVSRATGSVLERAQSAVEAASGRGTLERLAEINQGIDGIRGQLSDAGELANSIGTEFDDEARRLKGAATDMSSSLNRLRNPGNENLGPEDVQELLRASDGIADAMSSIAKRMLNLSRAVRWETRQVAKASKGYRDMTRKVSRAHNGSRRWDFLKRIPFLRQWFAN